MGDEWENHNMRDHDLLITINTILTELRSSVNNLVIKSDQKADKSEVVQINSELASIKDRLSRVENDDRTDEVKKEEINKIRSWGWSMWGRVIGALLFLMAAWQFFQNLKPQPPQIIYQNDATTTIKK